MRKIYNDSNSIKKQELLPHRGDNSSNYTGNSIVELVLSEAHNYGYELTDTIRDGDIIFTNDIYSSRASFYQKKGACLIKRLDGCERGVYSHRNKHHIEAINQSDLVIPISRYSIDTYIYNYEYEIRHDTKYHLIENWCDNRIFTYKLREKPKHSWKYLACSQNWNVPWKRFYEILKFAKELDKKDILYIIGKLPITLTELPNNVIWLGENVSQEFIAYWMHQCDVFVHLAHKPPMDKVICEALATGLPVICARSGWNNTSMSSLIGFLIDDCDDMSKDALISELDEIEMILAINNIKDNFNVIQSHINMYVHKLNRMRYMINEYYNAFNSLFTCRYCTWYESYREMYQNNDESYEYGLCNCWNKNTRIHNTCNDFLRKGVK